MQEKCLHLRRAPDDTDGVPELIVDAAGVLVSAWVFAREPARRKRSAAPSPDSSGTTTPVVGSGRDDVEDGTELSGVVGVRHAERDDGVTVRRWACRSFGRMV